MPFHILQDLKAHLGHWTFAAVLLVAAVVLSSFARPILQAIVRRIPFFHGKPQHVFQIAMRLRRPAQALVMVTALSSILPLIDLLKPYMNPLQKTLAVLWFLALGWLMIAVVYCVEDMLILRYDISVADNLRARRARTQMQVMRRLTIVLVIVVDIGLALSVFRDSSLWHYGAGLLASAGLASLVLATAAKSSASNLLAGLQIAFTEPIRLDDVVIVQGEWGKIEEITTTYVVMAIWDQRRLIIPLSWFIENPFQNWTRQSAEMLGTAFLYLDYTVPVEPIRQELTRILESSKVWDKRVNVVQVTDLKEHTMEIRCLMSAANSGDAFSLRCVVREKMIAFIRENYPEAFPRMRITGTRLKEGEEGKEKAGQLPAGMG